jgi:type III secretory pathway component EscV
VEGYLLAFPLLVLMTFLLPMIVAQTMFQLRADVSFTAGEIVGPIGGFVVLASLAVGLVVAVLRAKGEVLTPGSSHWR